MAGPARGTMDFFAAQAAAKQRTWLLVVWLALAWVGTIALAWAALAVLLGSGLLGVDGAALVGAPGFLPAVAAGVTLVTAGGSAWHGLRLARDGPLAIVEMVGGVAVDRASQDPGERRLANVVEEMAIAAGLPVPALYVLPGEDGINAFAAGFTPDRSVVAVTRGALDALSRDELQGVVAHEFSHLLNADAKLNLRLVAIVGGITVLALAGRLLVRGFDDLANDLEPDRPRFGRGGRFRIGFALVGLCLWIVGSVGAFFGRVIRAAVSRQREFLADAAAVQFTRNPDGLAGALAKIAQRGSAIASSGGPEVSHFFFASGLRSSWLATHPPIEERIRRISPSFLAEHARAAVARAIAEAKEQPLPPPGVAYTPFAETVPGLASTHTMFATVGKPGPAHVAYAADLLGRLPPDVAVATRHAAGARALATALLLDADPVARELQAARLSEGVRADAARLATAMAGASREDRMAILELALPSLDALPREAAAALVRDLAVVASADGRTTVFEWAVQRIVRRRLARALGLRGASAFRPRAIEDVQVEVLELLSTLAWLGARDEAGAQSALDAATAAAGLSARWRPLPRERARASAVDAALERLDAASFALKGKVLSACAACALADGRLVPAEAEIVRAVAASLGLPVPPLERPAPARAASTA